MDTLLPYVLAAGLFLVLEVLWCRPFSRYPTLTTASAPGGEPSAMSDWDPSVLPHLRSRLDAVADEMQLLEQDETIYARAFRYSVCKAAQEALLADLARFATRYQSARARPAGEHDEPDLLTLELQVARSRAMDWEEITI